MEDPSTSTAVRVEIKCREHNDKAQPKNVRHEPTSDPTGSRSCPKDLDSTESKSCPKDLDSNGSRSCPKDLDSLNDEQLRKLTKANTKKNHGGRSSRIRSQVERVFRRLDNIAADVKLQPRYSIDALPVVSPDGGSHAPEREVLPVPETKTQITNDPNQKEIMGPMISQGDEVETEAENPADSIDLESQQLIDALHDGNNDFDIEPATHSSGFTDSTTSVNTTPGSVRSVRISTSVTVLDYIPLRPVSIARLNRYEHPTRSGKSLQTRKLIAEEMNFPHFTIQRHDDVRGGANENKENNTHRRRSTVDGVTEGRGRPSPPPPRRVQSTGSTTVTCVVPTPKGAYGSRVNKP